MKTYKYIINSLLVFLLFSCSDVLDIQPKNKLSADDLFSSAGGVKAYMANLYFQMPVEDFTYMPKAQSKNGKRWLFNYNMSGPNNAAWIQAPMTDNAAHSDHGATLSGNDFELWWPEGYKLIRDVNTLIKAIPDLDILEEERTALLGEAAFIRAYAYYGLAKRYGGVSIIDEVQEYTTDVESLMVPRSTEEATWDFIMAECDVAIANLGNGDGTKRRANKWSAYALKSRAALHAASIAKFWDRYPMSGVAVEAGLVGMPKTAAEKYYTHCAEASAAIMNSGQYGLYRPNPANPEEAAENYRKLFEDPNLAPEEAIFMKGYAVISDEHTSNNYEIWFNPNQVSLGWPHPGRLSPTSFFADICEDYTHPGDTTKLATVADGDEDYIGYDPGREYIKYDKPYDIYKNKDARLWGSVILPGTMWKNTEIVMQAGYVEPDGKLTSLENNSIEVNGATYYTYGAANAEGYSGFDPSGGNHSRTGLSFKKFLKESVDVSPAWNQGTLDYMDFRYGEILLNYAEAVTESDYTVGDAAMAKKAINDLRKRAGHTTEVEIDIAIVQRERRVELCFENKRWWDLVRRREFHTRFNNTYWEGIFPILDLRGVDAGGDPKYIMVRERAPRYDSKTWDPKWYYRRVEGTGSNGLIQNPMY